MEQIEKSNSAGYKLILLLLAALFCTYLRISLLVVYPLLVIICFYLFDWKLDRNGIYIFALVFVCWVLSFRNGILLKYNLISFYYYLPFILLLFASPSRKTSVNYLKIFIAALTFIAFINDIAGIIQYINHPNDDSFKGIYGIFTVSQNGLSLLNGILFFYYLVTFLARKKVIHLLASVYFLICCVLGFYGAGMMVLIGAILLTYLKISKKNLLQLTAITFLTIGAAIFLMKTISPNTYNYNLAIVKRFVNPPPDNVPRKLIIFQNYFKGYTSNIPDLLLGSGPGTFNSRTAFMVGSPTYFNVDIIKSDKKPYYFDKYAYPLWNPSNTGPYDGFMNQPFSSLLALLGEYGLIITVLLFLAVITKFRSLKKQFSRNMSGVVLKTEYFMFKFCTYFLLLLLVIDNYVEYPEIAALLLLIIILSRQILSYNLLPVSHQKKIHER